MKFTYSIPTKILFGPGSFNDLATTPLPGKKALVVITAGKSMRANGYLDRLIDMLDKQGIGHALFDKILPNPIKDHVMEGAALAKANGVDFVVGLGGGSAIDSAKAIAIMAANEGDYWDYISGGTGKGLTPPNDPLPVVAITTTAGTGTEADPWTVTTKTETNEKIGGGYDKESSYDEWIESFDGKVRYLVLIGQTKEKIKAAAERLGFTDIILCEDLKEAVRVCAEKANPGDAVLLSPACASWGQFDNYEQRGDMFKEYVKAL